MNTVIENTQTKKTSLVRMGGLGVLGVVTLISIVGAKIFVDKNEDKAIVTEVLGQAIKSTYDQSQKTTEIIIGGAGYIVDGNYQVSFEDQFKYELLESGVSNLCSKQYGFCMKIKNKFLIK